MAEMLENVSKPAVNFVKGLRHAPYEAASISLALSRLYGDKICMYKTVHGLIHFSWAAIFAAPTRSGLRDHTAKIHQKLCNTRRHQHAFSVRVAPCWNQLPEEIVSSSSMVIFQSQLETRSLNILFNPSRHIHPRPCSTLTYCIQPIAVLTAHYTNKYNLI